MAPESASAVPPVVPRERREPRLLHVAELAAALAPGQHPDATQLGAAAAVPQVEVAQPVHLGRAVQPVNARAAAAVVAEEGETRPHRVQYAVDLRTAGAVEDRVARPVVRHQHVELLTREPNCAALADSHTL